MECRHTNAKLRRMQEDPRYRGGLAPDVVKAFRKRVQLIRAARDERDFYALKSLHYEKLKGGRSHQRSMRLNDQWRLIVELEKSSRGTVVVIRDIEDYHR